jgi:tetrahydromethanopterin S-methyltransferase subunit C
MAEDLIPNQIVMLAAIIIGILCIYGSSLPVIGGILVILSSIMATVYGTNTLRYIGKYSLGTGVPSIVYMLSAVALVAYVSAVMISIYLNQPIAFPILAILIVIVLSFVVSLICRYVFKIQVEILSKSFISISLASLLLMISMSSLIAQTYTSSVIYGQVIQNGIILLIMIMSIMAIQNPYNSCMGPNEDQYRTLSLACSNALLMLMVSSIISMLNTQYWILYLLISLIGWVIFFRQYVFYTKQQAASVRTFGLWPRDDGDD